MRKGVSEGEGDGGGGGGGVSCCAMDVGSWIDLSHHKSYSRFDYTPCPLSTYFEVHFYTWLENSE